MIRKNIIEDIKPLSRDARVVTPMKIRENASRASSIPREIPFEPVPSKSSPRYALWYVAVICLVGLLLSLSFLFESASVNVTPKVMTIVYDTSDTFTALKDTTDPGIVYTVMRLSGSETLRLPSSQSKVLSDRAKGSVLLSNTYTKGTYTVTKGTALVSSDGRIYVTEKTVKIPGYITSKAGKVTAGTIEVGAEAVLAGEEGNIESGDLSIQKLSKLPQGQKITAKIKRPFVGGASGKVYMIEKSTADGAHSTLLEKLKGSLIAKARVQVPEGYLFYEGATVFISDPAVQVSYSKESEVPVVLNGSLTVYLLKQDTLIRALALQSISQYKDEPVSIPKLASLSLLPKSGSVLSEDDNAPFQFSLNGKADILWILSPENIQRLLVSRKKSDFEALIATFSGVDKAQVVLKPFWKRSFPKNIDRIKVTITNPAV
ncbi:MAG: hypothetical protein KBC17_00240 [Candidatus Pacebacteria bacterium]|nr:hypothetical protein [Candidatus Paceibacterota bacterium]